jgi:hypothetical protein
MQSKPIRNSDFDVSTSKYVTFFNENFKRGRCDLLKKIQRSTRGTGAATPLDQSREILLLRDQVSNLEQQIAEVMEQTEERVRRLELEMLSRLDQLTMSFQRQQSNHYQLEKNTSTGSAMSGTSLLQHQQSVSMPAPLPQQSTYPGVAQQHHLLQSSATNTWDTNTISNLRGSSISSGANSVANVVGNPMNFAGMNVQQNQQVQIAPPTLPPHPKQKQLPAGALSENGTIPSTADRMNSLRGISTMTRGISGLSVESSTSAVLMRSSWEDKFFSMLMLDANDQGVSESNLSPTTNRPITVSEDIGGNGSQMNAATQLAQLPPQPSTAAGTMDGVDEVGDDDLSDVSSGDLP